MADQSSAEQPVAASASSPSVPPASVDPSPGVRITQHIREALTDTAGLVLAGYLVSKGAVSGTHALMFALALLLPSPLLLRVAKVLGARGSSAGAGAIVALLSASAAWAHFKSYAVLGAGVLGLAACLGGCASSPLHTQAIAPSIVERPGYGTCAEAGGKIEVARAGVVTLLTSVCWAPLDGGVPAVADASAAGAIDDPDAGPAIKPEGVTALVLPDYMRGMCTVPVFVQGAKTLADLDPIRCAVTAPGDRVTVFRRGQRWMTR